MSILNLVQLCLKKVFKLDPGEELELKRINKLRADI